MYKLEFGLLHNLFNRDTSDARVTKVNYKLVEIEITNDLTKIEDKTLKSVCSFV